MSIPGPLDSLGLRMRAARDPRDFPTAHQVLDTAIDELLSHNIAELAPGLTPGIALHLFVLGVGSMLSAIATSLERGDPDSFSRCTRAYSLCMQRALEMHPLDIELPLFDEPPP